MTLSPEKLDLVCYRTKHLADSYSLKTYESIGGYSSLKKIIQNKTDPHEIINTLKASELRGRGGAGFPTGLKWSFISRDNPGQKYFIVNSDESEPGTCKDRMILETNPHQVIEGLAIACYTIGATVGYNLMRGEFFLGYQRFANALQEAYALGYLGKNIMGSGIDIDIYPHRTAGAYICGEETALMNSMEGKRALPRLKPPFPANFGLYGKPTNINNCETVASVPVILEKGGPWFAELGTPKNGGTKIFSVSGHVNKPGNYEIPMGTPFKDLLELAGGMKDGIPLKAVIPGGSSMPVLPAHIIMETNLDYDSIMKAGSMLGSGGMIIMNIHTNMVTVARRLAQFYKHESCGQCTPCREGSDWVYRLLCAIESGNATEADIDRLARVAGNIEGRTICVFGEAIAWPIGGFLKHFRHEFVASVHQHTDKKSRNKDTSDAL
jgi:NADH-quinone oxidoreductase subunit F